MAEEVVKKWALAVKKNDPYALDLAKNICDRLSRAAAMAINCYYPDILILAGYVCQSCPQPLTTAIQNRIKTDVYNHQDRDITIMSARLGDLALIHGAANALLRQSIGLSETFKLRRC